MDEMQEYADICHLRAELAARDYALKLAIEEMVRLQDRIVELNKSTFPLRAQLAEAREAVHWLWGFWDGNTLIPHSHDTALQADIQEAFERCLRAVDRGRNA